jgi:hypothetical protein
MSRRDQFEKSNAHVVWVEQSSDHRTAALHMLGHRDLGERLRALLSLGGSAGVQGVRDCFASTEVVALPAGCSVDIELEAGVA